MSEQQEESAASAFGDFTGFAAVMDALAPDEGDAAAGTPAGTDASSAADPGAAGGQAAGGAAAAGADGGGAAGTGTRVAGGPDDTGAAAPTSGAPVAGADGDGPGVGGAADAGAAGAAPAGGSDGAGADAAGGGAALVPAGWTVEHAAVAPKLGELSTKLEEKVFESFQTDAIAAAREEHGQYFDALEKHPRLLVGQQVPRIDGKEGFEVLRDTNDAREWQEAVKGLLVEDVRDRASRAMDEQGDYLRTLHSSIELFQNNADLLPGTKGFDRELADRFATMAKPYELRTDDGKLNGYSIPVQPLIDQLRADIRAARAARPAAPAPTPAAGAAGAGAATPPPEPPQAGITSKAGSSTEAEDYSTFFGTLGLPNLQI